MRKKYFSVVFLGLILLARIVSSEKSIKVMTNMFDPGSDAASSSITIVIDPGHGGRDPGKVGVNSALEKDINLSISLKLRDILEEEGITVILTREEDIGLYEETDSNKKRADMNKRIDLINSSDATLAISIHQNSFTQESIKGAQVFYHAQSDEGRKLALIIQEQLKKTLQDGNHRKAKANDNYFMLKKTTIPLVIVECGYLSNREEAEFLVNEESQDKVALAICNGLLEYLR